MCTRLALMSCCYPHSRSQVRNQKSRSEYEEKWQQTMTQASDYQKKWQRSPMEARGQSKLCVVAGSSIVCMDTLVPWASGYISG